MGPPAFLFCFAAKGMRPLGEPVVLGFGGSAPGGSLCGAGGPYAPLCRRSALHPGRVYAGLAAPTPHYAGAPPCTRVTFPSRGKSPKARQGLRPLESPSAKSPPFSRSLTHRAGLLSATVADGFATLRWCGQLAVPSPLGFGGEIFFAFNPWHEGIGCTFGCNFGGDSGYR